MSSVSTGKRKKSYYKQANGKKSRRSNELKPGCQGFLITCNNGEINSRKALLEAYSILNEYADIKYGPEKPIKEMGEDDDGEDNLEDALKKEVSGIKDSNAKGASRRFQRLASKIKNVFFIQTDLEDPADLLDNIFSDLISTQIRKTKFCLRFLPVIRTCYAKDENIIKSVKEIVKPIFVEQEKRELIRFCITWKVTCNNTIKRDDVLPELVTYIYSEAEHITDYVDPDVVINIHVIGNVCCIGLLRNYLRFKKYNIDSIVQNCVDENKEEVGTVSTDVKSDTVDSIDEGGDISICHNGNEDSTVLDGSTCQNGNEGEDTAVDEQNRKDKMRNDVE